ncbi:MAG: right-handed parallel beta-helix repeat-containing protein, partial [Candidatus Omnitrophica bacterium]|nr:right-handed parallel beta-helix repeat-containing protein [Candidatus Omnitrophota bacterium]
MERERAKGDTHSHFSLYYRALARPFVFIFLFQQIIIPLPSYSLNNISGANFQSADDLAIPPAEAVTATYYVDDDACLDPLNPAPKGTGSFADPFCTIQQAADIVQAGDTVEVRGGTYLEMLWVTANGTPTQRITFKNYVSPQGVDEVVTIDAQTVRDWGIVIGRNDTCHCSGHYVTIDGFTVKNPRATVMGTAAGILALGTKGVTIRNNHVYQDYPGYPEAFVPMDRLAKGIYIIGYNEETVVEYNTVHHFPQGIGARSDINVGGAPIAPVFRGNHVFAINAQTDVGNAQNNAAAMGFSSAVAEGLAERNVIHHALDALLLSNENYGGHIFRNNILYLADPTETAGNGATLKTKAESALSREKVYGNIGMLGVHHGYEVNAWAYGPEVYHNLAYNNAYSGISGPCVNTDLASACYALYPYPDHNVFMKNNATLGNDNVVGINNDDLAYRGDDSLNNYNFIGDGVVSGGNSNSLLGTGPTAVDPKFRNLALLGVDSDGDKTPDILEPLNDARTFLTVGGNVDTKTAVEYAENAMRQVFELQPDSRLIDAGTMIPGLHCLSAGPHQPTDSPDCREWYGAAPDIGPFEYTGPASSNLAPVLNPIGDQQVAEGFSKDVPISASDPNAGDVLSFALSSPAAWITLTDNGNGSAVLHLNPLAGSAGVYYPIAVSVVDNGTPPQTSLEAITVTVNAPAVNAPPVANAGGDQTVLTGATVTLNGSASIDPDTGPQPLEYNWIQDPSDVIQVNLTGAISPTATFTAPATPTILHFALTVFDGLNMNTQVVTITVNASPPPCTADFCDDYTSLSNVVTPLPSNVVWDGVSTISPVFNSTAIELNPADPQLGTGLVGLWHLNDNVLGTSQPIVGSVAGLTGTTAGAVDCTVAGKFTTACNFNGVDQSVNLGDVDAAEGLTTMTVSAWVNRTGPGTRIVAKADVFALSVDSSVYEFAVNAGGWGKAASFDVPRLNQWQHVVGVYDGTQLLLYVDGVFQRSVPHSGTTLTNTNPLVIGAWVPTGFQGWNGMIDEVGIWNRALSATEVQTLFAKGGGAPTTASFRSNPITLSSSFNALTPTWTETTPGASQLSISVDGGATWCAASKNQQLTTVTCPSLATSPTAFRYQVAFSADTSLDAIQLTKATIAAPTCGDGVVSGGEVCDGALLNNQTCITQGFASGTLACNATCSGFNTSACVPVAGAAGTWYVDKDHPNCSDGGPGTIAAPFCTVQAGANAALTPGDTVLIYGANTPYVSGGANYVLEAKASGIQGNPITFRGVDAGKGYPVLDGQTEVIVDGSNQITQIVTGNLYVVVASNVNWINISNLIARNAFSRGIFLLNSHNSVLENLISERNGFGNGQPGQLSNILIKDSNNFIARNIISRNGINGIAASNTTNGLIENYIAYNNPPQYALDFRANTPCFNNNSEGECKADRGIAYGICDAVIGSCVLAVGNSDSISGGMANRGNDGLKIKNCVLHNSPDDLIDLVDNVNPKITDCIMWKTDGSGLKGFGGDTQGIYHEAENPTVIGTILMDSDGGYAFGNSTTDNIQYYHNLATDGRRHGFSIPSRNGNYNLVNNLGFNNFGPDVVYSGVSSGQIDYNFWQDNVGAQLIGPNTIIGSDPGLNDSEFSLVINPNIGIDEIQGELNSIRNQAEQKFGPKASSPLIDAGTIIPGLHCPSAGATGDCRVWYGLAPDIGPFEYNPGNNYYVDTNNPAAADTNPGTEALPFKTIQRAADLVNPGDTVLVKAGTYFETVSISRSGTAASRITFKNFGSDRPVIDAQETREFCFLIGKIALEGGGNYVTVDGFECKNFAALSGSSAGILVVGTKGAIVRNNHIYNTPWDGTKTVKGIFVAGPNEDPIIEYNHVHHVIDGIAARRVTGDNPGFVQRPIFRWNHVHHCQMASEANQNNARGMAFMNSTTDGLMEHNVVHHCDDALLGTDDSGGHVLRYNIAYLGDDRHTLGGNGAGIKTKPSNVVVARGDVLHHNISFLSDANGIEVNILLPSLLGATIYNNISYGNGLKGLTLQSPNVITGASVVKNNIGAGNSQRDISYDAKFPDMYDYNLEQDGFFAAAMSPHSLAGDPGFANIALLDMDANGDGTPDVLDPLNDPNAFPDAKSAILYAQQKMKEIFGPTAASPLIDAGVDLGQNYTDLLGQPAVDDPAKTPWPGLPGANVYDMGAFEAQTGEPVTNRAPVVSAITHDAVDRDLTAPGLQVYEGDVVTYSSSVSDPDSDPVTWEWRYTVNGGTELSVASGTDPPTPVSPAVYTYPAGSVGTTYTWTLHASDGSLTSQSSLSVSVIAPPPPPADTTPPSVTVTSPLTGDVSGTVAITVDAQDSGSGINYVEFYIDNALAATVNTLPYAYIWNTTLLSDGSHTLMAKAIDNATPPNVGISSLLTVNVANAPPPPACTADFCDEYTSLSHVDQASMTNVVWDGVSALRPVFSQGTQETLPDASTLLLFHLNENVQGTGQILTDSSPLGNSGSTFGGLDCAVAGKFNTACAFDGVDDAVSLGPVNIAEGLGAVTVSAWVNRTATVNARRRIVNQGNIFSLYEDQGKFGFWLATAAG